MAEDIAWKTMPVSSGPEALDSQASVTAEGSLTRVVMVGGYLQAEGRRVGSFLFLLWFQAPWEWRCP